MNTLQLKLYFKRLYRKLKNNFEVYHPRQLALSTTLSIPFFKLILLKLSISLQLSQLWLQSNKNGWVANDPNKYS